MTFSIPVYKVGATVAIGIQIDDDDGNAVDISAATITCTIRDQSNNVVAQPTVTLLSGLGQASISASSAGWPAGLLQGDLKIVIGGAVSYTQTFSMRFVTPKTT